MQIEFKDAQVGQLVEWKRDHVVTRFIIRQIYWDHNSITLVGSDTTDIPVRLTHKPHAKIELLIS